MDEKALALATNTPLGLTPDILSKLETYEDYVSFYIQLDEASTAFAWLKADTLLQMSQKLGEKSILQLSKDLNEKRSTAINYIRTAKAFPEEKRVSAASFSMHFRASFADSFNDASQSFDGEERFRWVEKALDEGFSTRELAEAIQREKKRQVLDVPVLPCTFCKKTDGAILPLILYSPQKHIAVFERFELHQDCITQITNFIQHGKKEGIFNE